MESKYSTDDIYVPCVTHKISGPISLCNGTPCKHVKTPQNNFWGRFHEKSQTEPDSRLSQGLKSETFVSAEFLAQMDFRKGGSAETSLKLWSQLFNLISYI